MTDPALAHALDHIDSFRATLAHLVAAPSVGADPDQAQGMETARQILENLLQQAGFKNLQRLGPGPDEPGQPALYGERLDAPGLPTLLVYGHYDVQPPEPLDLWDSPPFKLTERDGRLYGRGISDDKGPLLIALHSLAALVAVNGALPVNIKILIEGEEETGSPSMPAILRDNADLLRADAMLSADGARWRADLVSLNVGARGSGGFEIRLRTAAKDLHSGRYGGAVPNALHEMARLLAGLHDNDNRVTAPGFYDGIAAPAEQEQADLAQIPFDEPGFAATLETRLHGEAGFATLERLWLRPTVEVNGLWGGYTGAGAKTVTPALAHAKLTLRLVQGQDPVATQAAVIADLRARCPRGATLDILDPRHPTGASTLSPDHPLLTACSDALKSVTGKTPYHVRIGGSLPLVNMVQDTLGIDTVMFSFSTSDEDFHAPNEFLRVASIKQGFAAWIAVMHRVVGQTLLDYSAFDAEKIDI